MENEIIDHEETLRQLIISHIEKNGPITFSQFMEWCLYHPDFGYYSSEGVKIGKEGDYYTSSCVHPIFGWMVAKQLSQMAEILDEKRFDIIEMGGGQGFLCKDILDWMKKRKPHFFKSSRYYLLEVSPYHIKEQRERLERYKISGKVFWMDPNTFYEEKEQIIGCFLSNELVDAFPVHQVIFDQGELKEIYVTQRQGHLEEQMGPPSDPRLKSYFESIGITLQEGQRAEVNLKALDWIEKVGQCLKKGFVLTIDYGYLAKELYTPYRRHGTLLCYYQHKISGNPYEQLGKQDITSHVNFTALIKRGEEVGLQFTGLVPQYRFLIALGILEEMDSLNKDSSELDQLRMRLSLMHLIEPEVGMGEIYKVLILHKGISKPSLIGLRDLRTIPWPTKEKRI